MEKDKEQFEYTYSAEQQAEIEKIRNKYLSKEDDKLTQLRKLDESVTKKGTIFGISLGVIGLLLFGIAMSLALVVGGTMIIPSIILAVPGTLAMIWAYPAYKKITAREHARIAPQILALTEDLRI